MENNKTLIWNMALNEDWSTFFISDVLWVFHMVSYLHLFQKQLIYCKRKDKPANVTSI